MLCPSPCFPQTRPTFLPCWQPLLFLLGIATAFSSPLLSFFLFFFLHLFLDPLFVNANICDALLVAQSGIACTAHTGMHSIKVNNQQHSKLESVLLRLCHPGWMHPKNTLNTHVNNQQTHTHTKQTETGWPDC